MALAFALDYIERNELARLTNYSEYLEKQPPTHSVEIFENTSWSCAHGVERWRSDCGCHTGGQAGWNQSWRAPLRDGLDWLRDRLNPLYEEKAQELLRDPWAARDDYISVVLDRSRDNIDQFLGRHAVRSLDGDQKTKALKFLELQRHAMLMYTSCGWFFSELSGIETVQVIQYAARAVQLAEDLFGDGIEEAFLERLEKAKSNIPHEKDGGRIYEKSIKTQMVDWEKVGAHYAVSSLFETYPEKSRVYCYDVEREDSHSFEAGRPKLVLGRAKLTSRITRASTVLSYGALHFGDHNVSAGVRKFVGDEAYQNLLADVGEPFNRGDFPEVIRLFDREFGKSNYSLRSLFRDQQRKIVNLILKSALEEAEGVYRGLYERHAPTMRFLTDMGTPPPRAFSRAAQFVLNGNLRAAFETEPLDPERVQGLLEQARTEGVVLDGPTLAFALQGTIDRLAEGLSADPAHIEEIRSLDAAIELSRALPFEIELWKVQNRYYRLAKKDLPGLQNRASQGDETAREWLQYFTSLGENLRMRV